MMKETTTVVLKLPKNKKLFFQQYIYIIRYEHYNVIYPGQPYLKDKTWTISALKYTKTTRPLFCILLS